MTSLENCNHSTSHTMQRRRATFVLTSTYGDFGFGSITASKRSLQRATIYRNKECILKKTTNYVSVYSSEFSIIQRCFKNSRSTKRKNDIIAGSVGAASLDRGTSQKILGL